MIDSDTARSLKAKLMTQNSSTWTDDHIALLQHCVVTMMGRENTLTSDFTEEMWQEIA